MVRNVSLDHHSVNSFHGQITCGVALLCETLDATVVKLRYNSEKPRCKQNSASLKPNQTQRGYTRDVSGQGFLGNPRLGATRARLNPGGKKAWNWHHFPLSVARLVSNETV